MKLRERDLEIDFTDAIDAIVFDQMKADKPGYHGVGQMHRVDFVVELEKAILFVEVKDPRQPQGTGRGAGEVSWRTARRHAERHLCRQVHRHLSVSLG